MLGKKIKRRRLPSSEVSTDSDSNNFFSNYGKQSKTDQIDGTSCSKNNDSDSNTLDSNDSDDQPSRAYQNSENKEKGSNKGMSLMVINI